MSDIFFADNLAEEGHGRRVLRSGAVTVVARVANAVVQIGGVLFLARLLTPEDYGLVSMVAAIVGFAPLVVDLGTRDAVVQRPTISRQEVSAIFWITTGISTALTFAVAAAGPFIARFYGEPRLVTIALVLSLTFISAALTCQPYALLRRAMMFERIGVLEVVANLTATAIAIGMAFFDLQYWALVARPIIYSLALGLGVWYECGWIPSAPSLTPEVKKMLGFGVNVIGFTLADFASRSVDRVAIGYRYGPTLLGYYQNALFVFENLLDILLGALHGVAVAGLSKVQTEPKELWRYFSKALSLITFCAMPAFGWLAVVSQDLIVLMLGQKWRQAGVLLSIVALRGIPQSFERTHGWLLVATGRTDRWMRWGVFSAFAQFLALFAGLPFGPEGVASASVICMMLLAVPSVAYAGRTIGVRAADVVATVWRPMAGAAAAVVVGFLLRATLFAELTFVPRIALQSLVFVAVYLIIVPGLLRERSALRMALFLMRDMLPPRVARLLPSLTNGNS